MAIVFSLKKTLKQYNNIIVEFIMKRKNVDQLQKVRK